MRTPSKATLKKYGLSLEEWTDLYNKHDGCCHICLKPQSAEAKRALHVDHEHVKGWKDMPPEQRKQHVRGLICYTCNRFRMTRGTTLETARGMVRYLEEYEKSNCASKY